MNRLSLLLLLLCPAFAAETPTPPIGQLTTPGWRYEEIRRYKAPEAG